MTDPYVNFANSGLGSWLTGAIGLPKPLPLRRYEPGQPALPGPILSLGGGGEGWLVGSLMRLSPLLGSVETQWREGQTYGALVFDASACVDVASTSALYEGFHQAIRSIAQQGRILIVGRPPETMAAPEAQAIQRGLEGFVRSLGKEAKRAITANLLYVSEGAEVAADSSLAFFLSARSAYVSGQVVRVVPAVSAALTEVTASSQGLERRRVLVTGAARGIGEAIARLYVRQGAEVIALDVPQASKALEALAAEIKVSVIALDITAPDAGQTLLRHALERGGLDVVVHNAGITRDKTIARMQPDQWQSVMAVNLKAPLVLTQALIEGGGIRANGAVVCVSSISGIAGNMGQSNYALSKAGVIGAVQNLAPVLAGHGVTINAVAPGFIETEMTSAIPFAIREAGRRLNSMGQGGQPVDVAETIAWLSHPTSSGLNGQVVRVCGQSLLGA